MILTLPMLLPDSDASSRRLAGKSRRTRLICSSSTDDPASPHMRLLRLISEILLLLG